MMFYRKEITMQIAKISTSLMMLSQVNSVHEDVCILIIGIMVFTTVMSIFGGK